jgi:nucleoside-diphosphate-sugar epimerase
MMAMAAAKFGKCLRVHVICGGLNYGMGEAQYLFYDFFRKAWLSLHPEHAALPIIGSGHNRIPTIHVKDLANCIKLVIENKFKQLYFIAVDMGKST